MRTIVTWSRRWVEREKKKKTTLNSVIRSFSTTLSFALVFHIQSEEDKCPVFLEIIGHTHTHTHTYTHTHTHIQTQFSVRAYSRYITCSKKSDRIYEY